MKGDFITKIKAGYNQFTKAEKKVADYILQNPRDVLFMSITDLADECRVGDTSVFRFCKTMDLKGYQEFKMRLSLSLDDGKSGIGDLNGDITFEDGFKEMVEKVLNTNINALRETCTLLNEEAFGQAITCLHNAERIFFFGVGCSMLTAMKAMDKFLRIEPKVYCIQDSHMQAMMAANMKRGDVAVVFSYSGATKDTIQIAKLAKQADAELICVTRFSKSPLTAHSDITLLCGANEGPLQDGSTSSEISQLLLVDMMYTEYYRRYYGVCNRNSDRTARALADKAY